MIELKNLTVRINGKILLNNINFSLDKNQILCLFRKKRLRQKHALADYTRKFRLCWLLQGKGR